MLTLTRIRIEYVHDGHVGGPKQYNDFPLGNIFYFYANIFYCFSPPTWPPCTHSIPRISVPKECTLNILNYLYMASAWLSVFVWLYAADGVYELHHIYVEIKKTDSKANFYST